LLSFSVKWKIVVFFAQIFFCCFFCLLTMFLSFLNNYDINAKNFRFCFWLISIKECNKKKNSSKNLVDIFSGMTGVFLSNDIFLFKRFKYEILSKKFNLNSNHTNVMPFNLFIVFKFYLVIMNLIFWKCFGSKQLHTS
jgi:hypothetical protein